MARTRIETLKKMHLTTDLREGAEIAAPSDRASWQARTGVRLRR